jgi:hypothetical protein
MLIVGEAPFCAIRFGSALRYPSGALGTNRLPSLMVKLVFTISVYLAAREVGDLPMIMLVALLNVSQPLPWLDRNWINHQAHREMLIAASASHFDAAPRLPIVAALRFEAPAKARPASRRRGIIGGPSGM